MYKFLWGVQFLAVIIFIISVFLGENFYLLGLVLMIIILVGFYWSSPYMIGLEEARYYSRPLPWYKRIFSKKKKRGEFSEKKNLSDDSDDSKEIYSN